MIGNKNIGGIITRRINKSIFLAYIISLLLIPIIFLSSTQGIILGNNNSNGYIDITVEEAWEMLSNTTNGIQYPIDVRTEAEWTNNHIDTPFPEYPRHHNFYEWEEPEKLNEFLSVYQLKEIIIYCRSGGRSVSAANILIDNDFDGVIYNMLGGITQWTASGYPTVPNRQPEKPDISGPSSGRPGEKIEFTITTDDPDYDKLLLMINWSDGTEETFIGPYKSGEEVNISHTWTENGIYPIKVKAIDPYNKESEWSTFEFSLSKTNLDIIDIHGGFGSVIIDIKNIGEYTAEGISSTISVYGGLLSKINLTHTCSGCDICGSTLDPGAIKTENTRESGIILGLGNVEVSVSTWANNAEKITKKASGVVFGALIIIL